MYILSLQPAPSYPNKILCANFSNASGTVTISEPVVALALCCDNDAQKVVGLIGGNPDLRFAPDYTFGTGESIYTFAGYSLVNSLSL